MRNNWGGGKPPSQTPALFVQFYDVNYVKIVENDIVTTQQWS